MVYNNNFVLFLQLNIITFFIVHPPCPPARRIAPDCVDGGRVWRNGGVVVAERRRRRENNGTADIWPPNGIRVAAVGLGRREREQRAVRYAACATGWIPDFHSPRRQPASAAGVRRRGRTQVYGGI